MRPISLAVVFLLCVLPASAADFIRVEVTCPGADAATLEAMVLYPIFLQINGIEGVSRIETQARNDGNGTLSVYFQPRSDLSLAEVRVQNRVNLVLPTIPESCRQRGISVQKRPTGPPQFWLALTSTDPDHDEDFLNRYAITNLEYDYRRIPGLADVRVVVGQNLETQVRLNPNRLAAYKLMPSDVINSLRRQNFKVGASGEIRGKQSHETVVASGRWIEPDDIESVILRTSADGEILRLKDVAEIEFESPRAGFARVDGRPAALIEVTTWPKRVNVDQLLISQIENLPPGMSLISLADRSVDRLQSVEVRLPSGSTLKQTEKVVATATELIRGLSDKPTVFAFAEEGEPNFATIFLKAAAKDGPTATDIDKALAVIPGVMIRTGDAPPGQAAFPVRIAITDPYFRGDQQLREAADNVVAMLVKDKDIVGPALFSPKEIPQRAIQVRRDACAHSGVELDDLFTAIQTSLGRVYAADIYFMRVRNVYVQTDPQFVQSTEDLNKLAVRSAAGDLVPLSKLIEIKEVTRPDSVLRVNGCSTIVITAAPATGKSPAQITAKCTKLPMEVLPRGYRAIDLTSP